MQARLLTRGTAGLVLAWFIAFLAIAGIAPWVQAQPMDTICTASGESSVGPHGGGPADGHGDHTLKCFLCTGVSTPPPVTTSAMPSAVALGHALRPLVAAHLASLTGAPLPARGPPLIS